MLSGRVEANSRGPAFRHQPRRPPAVVVVVAAVKAGQRPRLLSRSPRLAVSNDSAVRVRGDVKRVYLYLSDLSQWSGWYPGVKSASRIKGQSNLEEGAQFAIKQSLAGHDMWTT